MKVYKRYTFISILKIGLITSLLAAFMLTGVDLFKNLDTYTSYGVSTLDILKLCLYFVPEAILTGLGPSFLFSVTYFLSQFHASNEYICVLNSGVKYDRIIRPCLFTGILITVLFFLFNEFIAIPYTTKKEILFRNVTYSVSEENDNRQIALSDNNKGILIYADEYIDSTNTLYEITLIEKNNNDKIDSRINAYRATWNDNKNDWILYDVYVYQPSLYDNETYINHYDVLEIDRLTLKPSLFRNLSTQISRMPIPLAIDYLRTIKRLNPTQYASMATEFYKKILSCLTPLVMIIISCSLNYKFKKNVMFFSLICSICIAVVYYVIQMITIMLADQGVILPYLGMLIPFASIIVITAIVSLLFRN